MLRQSNVAAVVLALVTTAATDVSSGDTFITGGAAGHERSLIVASPTSAPIFQSGPLAAGGEHAFGFSLGTWIGQATVRIAGLARSGIRFTPIADRDLNGDGRANDAVFIPSSESNAWASVVSPNVRSCIRAASERIAGLNSCTGPWAISSYLVASIPGPQLGMPLGSEVSIQLSNPLAVLSGGSGITYGSIAPVNATLLHVTGFNAATRSFSGEPLRNFGTTLGLSGSATDPIRVALAIRLPLGKNVVSQRTDVALESLRRNTAPAARQRVAMEFVGDVWPIPLIVLQSGDAIELTAGQRQALQALGTRWQATAARIVLGAYASDAKMSGGRDATARQRLLQARSDFSGETAEINSEIRKLLTPDQVNLLPESVQRMLNPRFWKYVSLHDAGDF